MPRRGQSRRPWLVNKPLIIHLKWSVQFPSNLSIVFFKLAPIGIIWPIASISRDNEALWNSWRNVSTRSHRDEETGHTKLSWSSSWLLIWRPSPADCYFNPTSFQREVLFLTTYRFYLSLQHLLSTTADNVLHKSFSSCHIFMQYLKGAHSRWVQVKFQKIPGET